MSNYILTDKNGTREIPPGDIENAVLRAVNDMENGETLFVFLLPREEG